MPRALPAALAALACSLAGCSAPQPDHRFDACGGWTESASPAGELLPGAERTFTFTFRNCDWKTTDLVPTGCALLGFDSIGTMEVHADGAATYPAAGCAPLPPVRVAPGGTYVVRGGWNGTIRTAGDVCRVCFRPVEGVVAVKLLFDSWPTSLPVRLARASPCVPLVVRPSSDVIRAGTRILVAVEYSACEDETVTQDLCADFPPRLSVQGHALSLFPDPAPAPDDATCQRIPVASRAAYLADTGLAVGYAWNGTWRPDGPGTREVPVDPGLYTLASTLGNHTANATVEVVA